MECLARRSADVVQRPLADLVRVELLTAQAMADLGKMNANLMCPSRLKPAFDDCVIGQMFHRPHVRDRSLRWWVRTAGRDLILQTRRQFRSRRTGGTCRRAPAQPITAVADEPGVDRLGLG